MLQTQPNPFLVRATLILIAALAASACDGEGPRTRPEIGGADGGSPVMNPPAATDAAVAMPTPGIDESALDETVSPCVDFYRFACGRWIDKATIPPGRMFVDRTFYPLGRKLSDILTEVMRSAPSGDNGLGDLYASCRDEAGIERNALGQLKQELATLDRVVDAGSLGAELAR